MRKGKKESILIVLLVIAMTFVLYATLVKPFVGEKPKYEVNSQEKLALSLMTQAFLNQNEDIYSFSRLFNQYKFSNINNKYAIAAEYYYLLNHEISLENNNRLYDEILTLANELFDTNKVVFENFTVNIDECGLHKYSSLEGDIINNLCDDKDTIYQIGDVYKQDDFYIVEFLVAVANYENIISNKCLETEKPLSYNLKLSDLDGKIYYTTDYNYCCKIEENCMFKGLNNLKQDIINQAKINNSVYKVIYQKKGENFTFYELSK